MTADGEADALLRPALEIAVAVARGGEEETPVVPAPSGLRPFLRFTKLPTRALAATRRALDADAEFRGRVAEAVHESDVGRAGWLYLARPEGWEEELGAMVEGAQESARATADRRAEHDARKRLGAAQAAARRADEAAATARREAADATAALAEERRARLAATDAAAAASRRAEGLELDRDGLRLALAAASAERDSLARHVAELEGRLSAPTPPPAPPPSAAPHPPTEHATAPAAAPATPLHKPAPLSELSHDPAAADRLHDAAEAAVELAARLRAAAASLSVPAPLPPRPPVASTPPAGFASPAMPTPPNASTLPGVTRAPAARPRSVATRARKPAPLPPAVFDDSLEAAEHLARIPGMVLVVDGYNASKTAWPDLAIAVQRRRLVDALAELVARTGVDARLVFDGAELDMPGIVPTTSRAVRVMFSPPGVEADDVVVEMVGDLPLHRPVAVASNDRRVRTGAARAGANVISTEQLLGLLRR